ncbi:hypothetical protein PG985_009500 [Apiospora marii]|uniref:Uncharacterized protein n=1 Tax=Apiospora marii TaxID=335849 RepID=A0ABR1RFD5_9PEZI
MGALGPLYQGLVLPNFHNLSLVVAHYRAFLLQCAHLGRNSVHAFLVLSLLLLVATILLLDWAAESTRGIVPYITEHLLLRRPVRGGRGRRLGAFVLLAICQWFAVAFLQWGQVRCPRDCGEPDTLMIPALLVLFITFVRL